MARNISFHLPACAVHDGVQRRQNESIAANALSEMRSRPLLGNCDCAPQQQLPHSHPTGKKASMRFVPPPSAWAPTGVAAPPSLTPGNFTFASMLGTPPLVVTNVALQTLDATLLGVSHIAPRPVADVALGWHRRINPIEPKEEVRCEYADQYSIGDPEHPTKGCCGRFGELLHGTLFSNVVAKSRLVNAEGEPLYTSALLGPTGHYERFSAWSHVASFFVFAAYAIIRQVAAGNRSSVEGVFASVAAWAVAFVFLASSLYHSTAADPDFAVFTRMVDYVAIYLGIAIGTTADVAVATRGFDNVPVVTILDIPLAATLLILFFTWRRVRLPKEATWLDDNIVVPQKVACSIGRGLFSRGHVDLHHSQLRQATSLLLTAGYFMSVPAAVMTLGVQVAVPVIALQAVGFVLAVFGMLLDRILEWPNGSLVEGKQSCCYPNSCGCVLTSHGVWHLIAMVSAACTVVAREYALGSY